MWYRNYNNWYRRAITLVEMIIAMALMSIIFAAVLPQIRVIQNSWDSKAGASETLQNGRVLMDHLNRNLSKAVRITAVSGPAETNGYIEFMDNDANNLRYDIDNISNYVEFGPVGALYDLAGPVSQLLFTCYDGNDFTTPITDVNSIRYVKVQTTLANPASLDQDMTFTAQAYIRTNALPAALEITKLSEPWYEYDIIQGLESALCQINSTHYLCVYRGKIGVSVEKGMSVVLEVDTDTWEVSQASTSAFEYESEGGIWPALAKIGTTFYLCAYQFKDDRGHAKILQVNTGNWSISWNAFCEFDSSTGKTPALAQIDQEHYLCAYTGPGDDGWAVVLTTNFPLFNSLSTETPFEFDTSQALAPALSQIDSTHYLCVYTGPGNDGWATVLTVNTGTWTISQGTPFEFDTSQCLTPTVTQIDSTHYLCAYDGPGNDGWAVVLTVNNGNWTITKETPFEYEETTGQTPDLIQIDQYNYLCAYTGPTITGNAVLLTVDPDGWTISKGDTLEYESTIITAPTPDLAQIDSEHYLCSSTGPGEDGFIGVLDVGDMILP